MKYVNHLELREEEKIGYGSCINNAKMMENTPSQIQLNSAYPNTVLLLFF